MLHSVGVYEPSPPPLFLLCQTCVHASPCNVCADMGQQSMADVQRMKVATTMGKCKSTSSFSFSGFLDASEEVIADAVDPVPDW